MSQQISANPIPVSPANGRRPTARYVAIITDGSGRWAAERGLPLAAGHDAAADTLKASIGHALALGVRELSVYTFSTENWARPADEVAALMEMFTRRIAIEAPALHQDGVKMRFIGRREGLPEPLLEQMDIAESLTGANQRMTLFMAFNYGGRAEIVDAARRFAAKRVAQAAEGRRAAPLALQSDEEEFRECLYAPEMHDPEVIIRTSGEQRLSNYLLWQSAYSELVFRDELWPDFTREALEESLAELGARNRRFGGR
jgi:undecaprenyl diphosphate synthase